MKIDEYDSVSFLRFTYEEERRMAEWVMDLMSKTWFSRENCGLNMHTMVTKIYQRKSEHGKDITVDEYADLGGDIAVWNDTHEELWQIPMDVFELEVDGKERTPPSQTDAGKKLGYEDQVNWIRQDTRRIWREVWRQHRLKGTDDDFLVFPGDDPAESYAEVQLARERRFWDEVERRSGEWNDPANGVSRSEVIRAVSDYMPRGEGDFRMGDPNKGSHESLLDRMEVEYPDPD